MWVRSRATDSAEPPDTSTLAITDDELVPSSEGRRGPSRNVKPKRR